MLPFPATSWRRRNHPGAEKPSKRPRVANGGSRHVTTFYSMKRRALRGSAAVQAIALLGAGLGVAGALPAWAQEAPVPE